MNYGNGNPNNIIILDEYVNPTNSIALFISPYKSNKVFTATEETLDLFNPPDTPLEAAIKNGIGSIDKLSLKNEKACPGHTAQKYLLD